MGARTINITDWLLVIVPLMCLGAIIGFRRGWKIEAVTAMGVFFTGLALAEAGAQLLRIVNKLPKLVYFLIGEGEVPDLPPLISGDDNTALFYLGVFLIAILLFYTLPSLLVKRPTGIPGTKKAKSTWSERFAGALIGGLTGFMVFNAGLQWAVVYLSAHPSTDKTQITFIFPPLSDLADPAKWLLIGKPLVLVALLGSVFLVIIYFAFLCPKKSTSGGNSGGGGGTGGGGGGSGGGG